VVNYFVYAVAALLVLSVILFLKRALFDRRPQKTGLVMTLLALPLYAIYYNDRWPAQFGELRMREAVRPLARIEGADINFASDIAPALIICAVLLVHMTVFQRVAVRERLQRIHDPIANFFAGSTATTLIGATLVSTFHWGWVGAVVVGVVFALIYLGVVALLAALFDVFVALVQYFAVWIKRKVFALATRITRASSWVSSLAGRLGLTSFADRIRADTMQQESRFLEEQEEQDRKLIEAYVRDRARRRRMLRGGPEVDEPVPPAIAAALAPAALPAAPEAPVASVATDAVEPGPGSAAT
jgi:hypothetical protein